MNAYQCKVSVKDNKPPVWWRVFIPAEISFSALSLLLDELCGDGPWDGFRFEIFRCARVWEPDEDKPLESDFYYDAYSAAHTAVKQLFQLKRPVYCYSDKQALKNEPEHYAVDHPTSYPLLTKLRADMDGYALRQRLESRFFFSGEPAEPLTRQELLTREKNGVLTIGLLADEPVRDETYKPSSDTQLREMASLLREAFEGSGRKRFSMRALLGTYPKKDLQGLAREYKLTGIKKQKYQRTGG